MRERRRSSSSSGSLARPLAREGRRAACAEREGGKGRAWRVENFISKKFREAGTYLRTYAPTNLSRGEGHYQPIFWLAIYSQKAIYLKIKKVRKSSFFGVFSSQNLTKN